MAYQYATSGWFVTEVSWCGFIPCMLEARTVGRSQLLLSVRRPLVPMLLLVPMLPPLPPPLRTSRARQRKKFCTDQILPSGVT